MITDVLAEAPPQPVVSEPPPRAERLDAIDVLRGAVMVVMALDHVRDFFSSFNHDPTDLEHTTVAMFLTRWVTHFCAPTFVFLAGAAAFLYGCRGRSRREVSKFLFTRGLWLVFLEVTIVRFGWEFDLTYRLTTLQVIWAIGCSMMLLSALVYLPRWAILAFGMALIAFHNLLDPLNVDKMESSRWLGILLHEPGRIHLTGSHRLFVVYPLVPWIGLLPVGYACGPLFIDPDASRRRRRLLALGLGLIAGFLVLRCLNLYGDPHPWETRQDGVFTVLSFVNVEKYPPSLEFLLMTLGPSIALLPVIEWCRGPWVGPLVTLGRVPQFFYVAHLYLIHFLIAIVTIFRLGLWRSLELAEGPFIPPEDHGFGLPVVYLAWAAVIVLLYPACRWFSGLKRRHRDNVWLSYL
ncbi:MAG: heparan-alpha-glucosaminide N-acetyltransferase domain-containing protein [Isosphaeraceae bacterium]